MCQSGTFMILSAAQWRVIGQPRPQGELLTRFLHTSSSRVEIPSTATINTQRCPVTSLTCTVCYIDFQTLQI